MILYNKWKEMQIGKQAFDTFKEDISIYNLHTLRQISWIGAIGGFVLVLCCLPPFRLLTMLVGYLAMTVLFSASTILSYTVLHRHKALVLPVYYIFIILFFGISIVMGTFWGRNGNAVTFVLLVVVLQLLIIDRPIRMHIIVGLLCIVFCVVDCHAKEGILLNLDISNCVVFYLLSIVISRQSINAKLSDIIIKHELKQQRDMDNLTKLSNRGAFERYVEQYIHENNKNAVMLIMDLDNFKSVNDQMGHEYGDLVLKRVGECMQATFRQSDLVSRLGGDEFVAFLPAISDLNAITDKVSILISHIRGIKQELNLSCSIGASAGISCYPENGCSFDELYRRADEALYCAKANGKGRVEIYRSK